MNRYQPALLGGLFIGILSSLPFVGAGNICCCLWVVDRRHARRSICSSSDRPTPIDTADAVLGGLLAGLIGAVIVVVALVAARWTSSDPQLSGRADADDGAARGDPAITPRDARP